MEIKLIDGNDLQKEFSVTILFKDVSGNAEKKILKAQKDYVLPGFRKGSVPISLIRNKIYKAEIEKSLHVSLFSIPFLIFHFNLQVFIFQIKSPSYTFFFYLSLSI